MDEVAEYREKNQPIKERTGGSTFKNPPGSSAWKLIDEAGCRGLRVGGAKVSEMHCNFLINDRTLRPRTSSAWARRCARASRRRPASHCSGRSSASALPLRRPPEGRSAGRGDRAMSEPPLAARRFNHVAVLMGGCRPSARSACHSGAACANALEAKATGSHGSMPIAISPPQLAQAEARCLLQRAARPLRRGRLRAGPARDA